MNQLTMDQYHQAQIDACKHEDEFDNDIMGEEMLYDSRSDQSICVLRCPICNKIYD